MKTHISDMIKKFRKEYNLTQEKLAEKLGVSLQAVSRWETGVTFPDIELLPDIASVFDISVDELLGVNTKNNNKIKNIIEKANSYYDESVEKISKKVESLNKDKEFLKMVVIEDEDTIIKNSLRTEGEMDGLEQGLAKGEALGVEKTARAMLKDNMPVQTISKYTGLSVDEIEKLK